MTRRLAPFFKQDGALERAEDLVEQELSHFVRYCRGLPEAEALIAALRRMGRSVGINMYSRGMAKEMLVASKKGMRGELEHRSSMRGTVWEDHLPG